MISLAKVHRLPRKVLTTQSVELLPAEVVVGKRIFYDASDPRMSAESYISCATCHFDGGHDGMVWDFTQRGEGLRNTTDLRGRAGMALGMVHWSGNFDEIQDFENDIRNFFGGTGFLSDEDFAASEHPLAEPKAGRSADLDALAAYVASLGNASVPRSSARDVTTGAMKSTAVTGQSVFAALNCTSCHIPSAHYVDRTRHNVGTLRSTSGKRLGGELDGIETPTLLGVHAGAPYFHNGSAKTLSDVFMVAGGITYQLEDQEHSAGVSIGPSSWVRNQQWHGTGYAAINAEGESVTIRGIAGGAGGAGQLNLRYGSKYADSPRIQVLVNGIDQGEVELEGECTQCPGLSRYRDTGYYHSRGVSTW